MENDIHEEKRKDIKYNWVTSSTFIFYVIAFCLLAFVFGGSCKLYKQGYKGKPDVEVPESTLYTPKYK